MSYLVVSLFNIKNGYGYLIPKIKINYIEKDTGCEWVINCGGTRGYFFRTGEQIGEDLTEQAVDSHFMVNRITTSLFLGGCGLFKAEAQGRIVFKNIETDRLKFSSHLNLANVTDQNDDKNMIHEIGDWYKFICQNIFFRRAADDAYHSLLNPIEADFYIYRGMEWLLRGCNIGWRELADDIGITFEEMKKFKKQVNVEFGQRHGIGTGKKKRAILKNCTSLVADFLFGFCNARKRIDKSFLGYTPEKTARIVERSIPVNPYL